MKFAHLADVHVGSWRDPKLKELSLDAFMLAIDDAINENVEFILISGDLFNTALPSIEHVRLVIRKLKAAQDEIKVLGSERKHKFTLITRSIQTEDN